MPQGEYSERPGPVDSPSVGPKDVLNQYQTILGREPSDAESSYISGLIKRGELDLGEVAFLLQGLPEYQQKLLETQSGQLETKLAATDAHTLGRAGSQITSMLAQQGRPNSSALASGLAQQAGELASQRQNALAAFYGNGLGNIAGQYQQLSQQTLGRAYGLQAEKRQRGYALEDFTLQRNAYEDYLNRQERNQRRQAIGNVFGTAVGAGVGGYYAPAGQGWLGAYTGGKLGGGAGSSFGGLFGGGF